MKKIALTSLIAMFTVAGAQAANVIDGNPLYMPKAGHFYSVTDLGSHSENESAWTLGEEFGYGITDRLAVLVETEASESHEFDHMEWGETDFSVVWRALDKGAWKLDLVGGYGLADVWADHKPFLDKAETTYAWYAGVRGGYTTSVWTLAGYAYFDYIGDESFDWNKEGWHMWELGLDGQYVINSDWSLLAGVEYTGFSDSDAKNDGLWNGEFGVNYNIDATKFVGAYVNGEMNHHGGTNQDEWKWEKGYGFGVKFGIDF